MSISKKLPFNHPLVQAFNEANQRFREACRAFRKVQVMIGAYDNASPTEQLFYLQQKKIYSDACKAYNEARNTFQREVNRIYNPIKPESLPEGSSEHFQFLEDVLKGDSRILKESLEVEKQQHMYPSDPWLAFLQARIERGESVRITPQIEEEYKNSLKNQSKEPESPKQEFHFDLSLTDEIKLPEE